MVKLYSNRFRTDNLSVGGDITQQIQLPEPPGKQGLKGMQAAVR